MTVLYIHANPVSAGLCDQPIEYPWSSRHDLGHCGSIVDWGRFERILPIPALLEQETRERPTDATPLAPSRKNRAPSMTDEQAWQILFEVSGASSTTSFQGLPAQTQWASVSALRARGIPIRQITRLTGLSFSSIARKSSPAHDNNNSLHVSF